MVVEGLHNVTLFVAVATNGGSIFQQPKSHLCHSLVFEATLIANLLIDSINNTKKDSLTSKLLVLINTNKIQYKSWIKAGMVVSRLRLLH